MQNGQIVKIGESKKSVGSWYVRYRESRKVNGVIERKRASFGASNDARQSAARGYRERSCQAHGDD